MNNPVIWVLYDDGYGSWNRLGYDNVFSLGINDHKNWKNYFKVDLSTTNLNLIKDLEKVANITGRPSIIIAHPPCESWSIADNQRRAYRNCKKETEHLINVTFYSPKAIHTLNDMVNMKNQKHLTRTYAKQVGRFISGLGTSTATVEIIRHFKPAIYVVENPQTSKIWEFFNVLDFSPIPQLTYYNKWDNNFTPKPTIFASNRELYFPLHTTQYTPNKKTLTFGRSGTVSMSYDLKSRVPKELLEHIYRRVIKL